MNLPETLRACGAFCIYCRKGHPFFAVFVMACFQGILYTDDINHIETHDAIPLRAPPERGVFMGLLLLPLQFVLFIPAFFLFLIFFWIIVKCLESYDRKQSRKRSAELERIIRRATTRE